MSSKSLTRFGQAACAAFFCLVLAFAGGLVQAQTTPSLGVLHNFGGTDPASHNPDGSIPYSALALGPDGFFYGTTYQGGFVGSGTIFKMRTDGSGYEMLHNFTATSPSSPYGNVDGASPLGRLLLGPDGFWYGTTAGGGSGGTGTVFKIKPDGSVFAAIHSFPATSNSSPYGNADGAKPFGGLTLGSDGLFYGVAQQGGANGSGTLFQINSDGSIFNVIHTFSAQSSVSPYGNSDGRSPHGPLLAVSNGFFYGVTQSGGANGQGTVYRVHPDGSSFLTLHSFSATSNGDNADGADPVAGLTPGSDGLLYGTAQSGGANGVGTVFSLHLDGSGFAAIHTFSAMDDSGHNTDGASPSGGVTQSGDGLFYGVGEVGGSNGYGTVFRLAAGGDSFQTVHAFTAPSSGLINADGWYPNSTLTFAPDGFLYGTTFYGGASGYGVVFKIVQVHTHLLWNNTDGKAAFWNVDGSGNLMGLVTYGPFTDGSPQNLWHATAMATGPDGVSHLVWNNPDGKVALWNVQTDGSVSATYGFGPFADGSSLWHVAGVSVGPDNLIHLLWTNPDGKAALWAVTQGGSATVLAGYGPYSDGGSLWAAVGVSTGPDNVSHLLWRSPAGHDAFWNVSDTDGSIGSVTGYGPYTDGAASNLWYANALSVGPDNVSHLLWDNTDGKAAFWNVSSANGAASVLAGYGPFFDGSSPWTATGLATGPDNVSHLLWNNPDGHAALWALNATGGAASVTGYGPYTDGSPQNVWGAVAVAVGP